MNSHFSARIDSFKKHWILLFGIIMGLFYFLEITGAHPKYGKVFYQLGIDAEKSKREEKAIRCYQKSIHFDPYAPEAYNNLGLLYSKKGDFQKAREYLQQSISVAPDFYFGFDNLGLLYLNNGYYDRAIACFLISLRRINNTLTRYQLGVAYFKKGYFDNTLEVISELKLEDEFVLAEKLEELINSN